MTMQATAWTEYRLQRDPSQRLGRLPAGHRPPAIQYQHAVVTGGDLGDVVSHVHHGELGPAPEQRRQILEETLPRRGVEPDGGLVEQQQLHVRRQGPGDQHPLALAGGERGETALRQMVRCQQRQLSARLSQSLRRHVPVEHQSAASS